MVNALKRSIILFIGSLLLLAISIFFICKEKRYCGTVKYKVMDQIHRKYSAENEPILVINWSNGSISNVSATWNDYLSAKVGDNICYQMRVSQFEPTFYNNGIIFGISMVCAMITLAVLLANILEL